MNARHNDIEALLKLLTYAKEEAQRLELIETVGLLDLPALSVYLEYTGLSIEDVEKVSDPINSTIHLIDNCNTERFN